MFSCDKFMRISRAPCVSDGMHGTGGADDGAGKTETLESREIITMCVRMCAMTRDGRQEQREESYPRGCPAAQNKRAKSGQTGQNHCYRSRLGNRRVSHAQFAKGK